MTKKVPVLLTILDGWGYSEDKAYNAIYQALTPNWDKWWQEEAHILLDASGPNVGLPDQQMGNSEVGHMHMGAGRIVLQDFTRINKAIDNGDYFNDPLFLETIETLKKTSNAMHVLGLLSPGGVHSHEDHLYAFIKLCYIQKFNNVYLHLFLDGRDTPPKSAKEYIKKLQKVLEIYPCAKIASICGRYYAMDRDNRFERIEPVYDMLTQNSPVEFNTVEGALEHYYNNGIYDEFTPPTKILQDSIRDGDAIFFFNFRSDRARQLTSAFINEKFAGFIRKSRPLLSKFITMTPYAKDLATSSVFPELKLNNTLGEVLAKHKLMQLRAAETEKYAHVTFFFNGGIEAIYPFEERILVPSPKVATYDLAPEMSARELTSKLTYAIKQDLYDVIICNFANADMVGHTGNIPATIQAIECLDECLGALRQEINKKSGFMLITSDHGNAEAMYDETLQQPQTAHTNLPVPLVFIGNNYKFCASHGSLIDIAPTILTLLNLEIPLEMTGKSLLAKVYD